MKLKQCMTYPWEVMCKSSRLLRSKEQRRQSGALKPQSTNEAGSSANSSQDPHPEVESIPLQVKLEIVEELLLEDANHGSEPGTSAKAKALPPPWRSSTEPPAAKQPPVLLAQERLPPLPPPQYPPPQEQELPHPAPEAAPKRIPIRGKAGPQHEGRYYDLWHLSIFFCLSKFYL